MIPYRYQTKRVVAAVSPFPLHSPTHSDGSAWHRARPVVTANVFPRLKEGQIPPKRYSYAGWWRNGRPENQRVVRIACRNSCAESRKNQKLFLRVQMNARVS